jgi:hypothetical protein
LSAPIQANDRAIVIAGMGRAKSPNVGLEVRVDSLQGNHSKHGVVWRCTGAGVKQLSDAGAYVETGWADFPASWLQKIEPTPTAKTTESTLEVQP